jgi:hypothetical protein
MYKTWFERKLGDISMLAIIIPGVAFLMAYAYAKGYCSYFNIPSSLITIGAKEMASMVLFVIVSLFLIYLFDFALVQLFFIHFFKCYPENSKIYQDQFLNYSCNVIFCCMLIALCIIAPIPKGIMILFFCTPVLLLVGFIVSHVSFLRRKKRNQEIQMVDKEREKDDKEFPGIIERIIGTRVFIAILFVICLYIFTMNLGTYVARNQNSFYEVNKRVDVVGVFINDNNQLIAKYVDDKELSKTEAIDITTGVCFEEISNPEFAKLVYDYNEGKKENL